MPRYVFVVRALSPHDGGWVRCFGVFRREEDAWMLITASWGMMVSAGDYQTIEVVRTIRFYSF